MSTYYAARVELHGFPHNHTEYAKLHAAMEARGFSRIIVLRDGSRWHLPPAEYIHDGSGQTTDEVDEKAKAVVIAIGHANASIVVHQCDDWNGYNLKPA